MRGDTHVRFGGRAGETDRAKVRYRAPARPYDPTMNLTLQVDTYIFDQTPNVGYPGSTELRSGYDGGVYRSLLAFSIGPILWSHVTDASLQVWENWSGSCTASWVDLWSVDRTFDGAVTWNTRPNEVFRYASLNVAYGGTGCSPAQTVTFQGGGDSGKALKDLVQEWADGATLQPGFEIRARTESDPAQFKKFDSSDSDCVSPCHRPRLIVTYNHDPDPPRSLISTPDGMGNVTLQGIFTDPDQGVGKLEFTVWDQNDQQVGLTYWSLQVNHGQTASVSVPASVFGTGYSWKARGYDLTYYSRYSSAQSYPPVVPNGTGPPWNIVVIMADDLDFRTLDAAAHATWANCNNLCPLMRNYRTYFEQQGVVFTNSFVSYSLCCPSRATFLTGRYAHNTNVKNNEGSDGGCAPFADTETLATWLTKSYDVGLIGKYLNGYGSDINQPLTDKCKARNVPPGWDYWHSLLYARQHEASYQYNYWMNQNNNTLFRDTGTYYQTNKLADDAYTPGQATSFLNTATEPFFLYAAPSAPHLDRSTQSISECVYQGGPAGWPWGSLPQLPDVAPYDGLGANIPYEFNTYKPLSYNEDTLDKPSFLRVLTEGFPDNKVNDVCIKRIWEDRLESLGSVDDLIKKVVDALNARGILDKTVLIFTSDNGYYNGEHRLHVKIGPYEEGIQVPLAVRYPPRFTTPVNLCPAAPSTVNKVCAFVVNHDLAPTIAELAAVTPTGPGMDGRSLVPFLNNQPPSVWRKRFLVEHWPPVCGPCAIPPDASEGIDFYPRFTGIRTNSSAPDPKDALFMRHIDSPTGGSFEYEYYEGLAANPGNLQLTNKCDPQTFPCPQSVGLDLRRFLAELATCSATSGPGYTCKELEDDPDAPPSLVKSFSPLSGPVGTPVTIYGYGFTGAAQVRFNGTLDPSATVLDDNTISAHVPTGATTGPISVTTAQLGTAFSLLSFTVT